MKFDKQIAIILVLLSMLLSAVGVSIYFYKKNQEVIKNQSQLVTIFVAKENIKKNTLITEKDIKQTSVARQYILTKPLLKKEIINKYANEAIYKNEAFLKEKLSIKIKEEEKEKESIDYKYNSYNMKFQLFQNPNFDLKPNDIIKIISVFPNPAPNSFSVQYVAEDIRILGFLINGKPTEQTIIKKKIKKVVKKQQIEEIIELKTDELILDIKHDVLLSLIDDYNKGKQLWMVKTKPKEEKNIEEKKVKKELEPEVKKDTEKIEKLFKPKKKVSKKKTYTQRSYPVKWYKAKNTYAYETATITYSNSTKKEIQKAKIQNNIISECGQKDNLLHVISNTVYLRKHPSIRAKIHKKIYKNYIVPHKGISKINPSWYMTCDGSYIQVKNVKEINYDEYKRLNK